MSKQTQCTGVALLPLLIVGAFVLAVVVVFQTLNTNENAMSRDAMRLADMRAAEILFQTLARETGSFRSAAQEGCDSVGNDLAQCNGGRIKGSFAAFRDPGRYQYTIRTVPDETTFAVTFTLERAHGSLGAGDHTLTPKGIQ